MRRFLRRRVRRARAISLLPFLPLLFFLLSAAGSAQTVRRGPSARAHRVHQPDLSDSGSVDVSPGDWSQLGRLQRYKPEPFCCSDFGGAVAISGDTVVAGDTEFPLSPGAFVFAKPHSGWKNMLFTAKLNAPLGGPYFLTSCVAIDGDTIVAGTGESVAYVYVKPEGSWSDMYPTAILSIGDLENGFECSVAISGNTIIVGDTVNNQYSGAVNVFVKPATGWHDMTPTATLTASDGQPYDDFGMAVSISGKTVAVGATQYAAAGKAYVFVEPPAGWTSMTQTAELRASDAAQGSEFGFSISTSGERVLVGSRGLSDLVAAYMFVKPEGGWRDMTETATLTPADRLSFSGYGVSVVVSGKTAAVGAPYRSRRSFGEAGGAYVFTEPSGGWRDMTSSTVLTGSDARYEADFGTALAMTGNLVVVGAPGSPATFVFGHP
jgi:hypothetical protein